MIEREALRLALKALQSDDYWTHVEAVNAIHKALDTSLAQPAVSETHKRKPLTDEQWQVIADTLDCFITRSQKDIIEDTLGITDKEQP